MYNSFSDKDKLKTTLLFSSLIKRDMNKNKLAMYDSMKELSKEAKANGLTEEILNEILKEID